MKSVSIVGNGPISTNQIDKIDQSDYIIRFNSPPRVNIGSSAKTNLLVISNSSKQTPVLLSDPHYISGTVFQGSEKLLLPYDPTVISMYMPKPNLISRLKGSRADWTELCINAANKHGKDHEILESDYYMNACSLLGFKKKDYFTLFPSSGFLAIIKTIQQWRGNAIINLFGFGFTGWKRHSWNAEQNYVQSLSINGELFLHESSKAGSAGIIS